MTKQENLKYAETSLERVEKEWENLNIKNGQIYEEIHQGVSEKGFNHIQEMNQNYLILSIKTQLRKRQLTVAQIEAGVYMPEINKDILQKKRRAYKQEIKHLEAQMIQYTGGINWSINS